MSETKRIRWEDDGAGGFEGYAGTLKPHAFTLWQSPCDGGDYVIGDWVLVSTLPIPASSSIGYTYSTSGKDSDALKAEAERWLEEFARSLGAVFPEAVLALADHWKQFAARGDAQDECADMLRETIAAALGEPATIEDVVADSIEQQSAYRNELRHLPGYMSREEG